MEKREKKLFYFWNKFKEETMDEKKKCIEEERSNEVPWVSRYMQVLWEDRDIK